MPTGTAKYVTKKWTKTDWADHIRFAKPSSGGGQGGVVFVWTGMNQLQWTDMTKVDFVLKPCGGSAAPTRVAEKVLAQVADVKTANTQVIPRTSEKGAAIIGALSAIKGNAPNPTRWNQVWDYYTNCTQILVQDVLDGVELDSAYGKDGATALLLWNKRFMANLGKLFVADAVIGNGDRLFKMNTGNIMFQPDGTLCGIDSATILSNFDEMLASCTAPTDQVLPHRVQFTPTTWQDYSFGGQGYDTAHAPTLGQARKQFASNQLVGINPNLAIGGAASSFTMESLWDLKAWWDNEFKRSLLLGMSATQQQQVSAADWKEGYESFVAGVEEGLQRVDRMFETKSFGWLKFKFRFFRERKKHGSDPNMDWMNLKIRRRFFLARRSGMTQKEAEDATLQYVENKNKSVWQKIRSKF